MSVKVQVVFYSMYGHVYMMAETVVAGARQVEGAVYQVPELVPPDVPERGPPARRLPICRPYGASTLAGVGGKRQPSENELGIAQFQGRHVATLARALVLGR